eukprot:TRINITY_DN48518_c0_g1_i1.p1 TRINITY_DN48518_c0_g1~~TRINITY_DN48518_c0_g1_i1.p1  ORF type:complete len:398 (+),score=73.44 TRINITY_DN48518_c0_g1_i1:74-1267(+)
MDLGSGGRFGGQGMSVSSGLVPAAERSSNSRQSVSGAAFLQAITGRRASTANSHRMPWQSTSFSGGASASQREEPLPSWVVVGDRVAYKSRSTGQKMEVYIEKVSRVRKEVTITFAENRATWKKIPFSMIGGVGSAIVPLTAGRVAGSAPAGGSTAKTASGASAASVGSPPAGTANETPAASTTAGTEAPRPAPAISKTPAVSSGGGAVQASANPPLQRPPPIGALVGGLTSKVISDKAILASSYYMNNPRHGFGQMWRARISNSDTAWRSAKDDMEQCIKWDFGRLKKVTAVQTKGNFVDPLWVTKYQLSYSVDGSEWARLGRTFAGNSDQDTLEQHAIDPPFVAKMVRLHPTAWQDHISMRVEFLGTLPTQAEIAAATGSIETSSLRDRSRSPRR